MDNVILYLMMDDDLRHEHSIEAVSLFVWSQVTKSPILTSFVVVTSPLFISTFLVLLPKSAEEAQTEQQRHLVCAGQTNLGVI